MGHLESEDGICNRQGSHASLTNMGEQDMQIHSPVAEYDEMHSQAQFTEAGARIAADINHLRDSQRNGNRSNIAYNSQKDIMDDAYSPELPSTVSPTPTAAHPGEPGAMLLASPGPVLPTRNQLERRGETVKAGNLSKNNFSSYEEISHEVCSNKTKTNLQ